MYLRTWSKLDAQSEVSASTPICRNQRWHEWELRQYCPQNIYSLNQRPSTEHSKGKSCTDGTLSTLLQTEHCEGITKNRAGVQNILRLQSRDFPLAFACAGHHVHRWHKLPSRLNRCLKLQYITYQGILRESNDHRAIMLHDNIYVNTVELDSSSAICDCVNSLRYLLYNLNTGVTKRKINSPPQLLKHCAFAHYFLTTADILIMTSNC